MHQLSKKRGEEKMYKDEIHELLDKYSIQNEVNEFYKSLLDGLERKYDLVPISTGFPALDQILNGGIHSNQLITIGARPSIGKTAFAISLIRNMLERDKKILFFSLAMSSKDIITRLVASISRVNLYNIINVNFGDDEFNGVMYSIDCLYDKALYIVS